MKPLDQVAHTEEAHFRFAESLPEYEPGLSKSTVRGSQFNQPLFEYSGACSGCGQTPYLKLLTQLFGNRMLIANATGCSSIYGSNAPTTPYCTDRRGRGPAWASSLFEDNAEYGYGYYLAVKQLRQKLTELIEEALSLNLSAPLREAFNHWLEIKEEGEPSLKAADRIKALLEAEINRATGKERNLLQQIDRTKTCWPSAQSGLSAETAGHTILALADWTMSSPPGPMLTCWFSIPRFTPTPVDSRRRPRQPRR